jgi:hypothetical protein
MSELQPRSTEPESRSLPEPTVRVSSNSDLIETPTSMAPPTPESEPTPSTGLGMRVLTLIVAPFVLAYLLTKAAIGAIPTVIRSSLDVIGRGLHGIAHVAVSLFEAAIGALRAVKSAIAAVFVRALSAARAFAVWLVRPIGQVVSVARELTKRALVLLRAGTYQLLLPLRWAADMAVQLGRRASVLLRSAARATLGLLRMEAGVMGQVALRGLVIIRTAATAVGVGVRRLGSLGWELVKRAVVVLRAGAYQLLGPLRWAAALAGQLGTRLWVLLRVAARATLGLLRTAGGALREVGVRALVIVRAAASAVGAGVRRLGSLGWEITKRALVLLRAGTDQLLRPLRWAADMAVQLGRRAWTQVAAVARGTGAVIRKASGFVRDVVVRMLVMLRAATHQLLRPVRWAAAIGLEFAHASAEMIRGILHRGTVLMGLMFDGVAETIRLAWRGLRIVASAAFAAARGLIDVFLPLARAVGSGVAQSIGRLIGIVAAVAGRLAGVVLVLLRTAGRAVGVVVGEFALAALRIGRGSWQVVLALALGLAGVVRTSANAVAIVVGRVVRATRTAIAALFRRYLVPAWRTGVHMVVVALAVVIGGPIVLVISATRAAAARAVPPIRSLAKAIRSAISSGARAIRELSGRLRRGLIEASRQVARSVRSTMRGVISSLRSAVSSVRITVRGVRSAVRSAIANVRASVSMSVRSLRQRFILSRREPDHTLRPEHEAAALSGDQVVSPPEEGAEVSHV